MAEEQTTEVDKLQAKRAELEAQMTEEEQVAAAAMVKVAEIAHRLVLTDKRYGKLVASMLASRQLYAVCYRELERLCDDTNFKKATKVEGEPNLEEVGSELSGEQLIMLKEILINSAAVQAQQPFNESHLLRGMIETVFPWMQEMFQGHNKQEHEQLREEFLEKEKVRVALPVSFGVQIFPPTAEDGGCRMHRHKPLLLVGERKAVRWLVDYILEESASEVSNVKQVVRLNSGGEPKHTDDPRLLNVPQEDWVGAVSSIGFGAFRKQYEKSILPKLVAPPDLLVVDDLMHVSGDVRSILPLTSRANAAIHRLRRWAEASGSLLISCLPLDRELKINELNSTEYVTLGTHNVLRSVVAERITTHQTLWYKISVGQHEVARIPVEELEAYAAGEPLQP